MYDREKIINVLKDIQSGSSYIKPYVVISQPRRSLDEPSAQSFTGAFDNHLDLIGYSHDYHTIVGQPVDVARNYLFEQAIESGAKYLFFIGDDTVVPTDAFIKLRDTAEKNPDSMIVGVYYMKLSAPLIMVKEDDYIIPANVDRGQVYEVWMTGLDCALIPISIIRKIKEDDPEIPFCCVARDIEGIDFVGEDNFFIHRLHTLGFKILVNTDVQCLHIDIPTGKYTAHPDIKLSDYKTNVPITVPFTTDDKEYLYERWASRVITEIPV